MLYPNPEDDIEQVKRNEEFEEVHASEEDVKWNQDPKSYITNPKSKSNI